MKTILLSALTTTLLGLSSLLVSCAADDGWDGDETASTAQGITNGYYYNTGGNRSGPMLVAVYHGGTRPCSGTILKASAGWILTAAHCVTVDQSVDGAVKAYSTLSVSDEGSPGLTPPANAKPVKNVILHGTADMALLRVDPFDAARGTNHGLWLASPYSLVGKELEPFGYGRYKHMPDADAEDGTSGAGTLRSGVVGVTRAWNDAYEMGIVNNGQMIDHGDSGGPTFNWFTFENEPEEAVRFITGVHWMSSPNVGYDVPVSQGTKWLMDNVGWMFIFRVRDWGSTDAQYLDVQWSNPAAQTPVWTWDYNGSSAQRWKYDPDTLTIKNELGLCLDVKYNGSTNGTPVWMYPWDGNVAQQWEFTETLAIRNVNGMCLDVPSGNGGRGHLLQIWDCNSSSAQRWAMSPSPY